jgi:hypothetical protein
VSATTMPDSPLEWALHYATRHRVPVFPCIGSGPRRKRPYAGRGFHDGTVLDIDVKRPEANGFDTLDDLGHSILPETPMAHTPRDGLHVYFDPGERELRNSAGLIGAGLDVRGDGGYVILPSPGSGYEWDPQWNFRTVAPVGARGRRAVASKNGSRPPPRDRGIMSAIHFATRWAPVPVVLLLDDVAAPSRQPSGARSNIDLTATTRGKDRSPGASHADGRGRVNEAHRSFIRTRASPHRAATGTHGGVLLQSRNSGLA